MHPIADKFFGIFLPRHTKMLVYKHQPKNCLFVVGRQFTQWLGVIFLEKLFRSLFCKPLFCLNGLKTKLPLNCMLYLVNSLQLQKDILGFLKSTFNVLHAQILVAFSSNIDKICIILNAQYYIKIEENVLTKIYKVNFALNF